MTKRSLWLLAASFALATALPLKALAQEAPATVLSRPTLSEAPSFTMPEPVPIRALRLTSVTLVPGADGEAPHEIESEASVLRVGDTVQLHLTYVPEDTTQRSVVYSTNNKTGVVAVDRNGLVTAQKTGKTTVTVTSLHNERVRAVYGIDVWQYPQSVAFKSAPETLSVGGGAQVAVTVLPADAKDKAIIYAVSDESVAKVDARGRVRGVKPGVVTLTATCRMDNAIAASVDIRVIQRARGIRFVQAPDRIAVGEARSIEVAFTPEDTSIRQLAWKTNSPSVAKVDDEGVVTGVAPGMATITAETTDGSKKVARFFLRVTEPAAGGDE